MTRFTPLLYLARAGFMLSLLACLVPATAQTTAGEAHFSVETTGAPLSLRVATQTHDGVVRADMRPLAEGMGAGFALTASRMQVDLAGNSAWVYLNDTRVTASQAAFELALPVIERDGRAWMSVGDVSSFFRQAFGLTVRMAQAAATAPDAGEAPLDPLVDAEPLLQDDDPLVDAEPLLQDDEPLLAEEPPAPDPLQEISNDAIRDMRAARGPERIVIDPGHGGEDAGIAGPSGVLEKDVALAVAKELKARLSGRIGQEVVLTREDDRSLDVAQRAAKVDSPATTLFISIHCGGAFAPNAAGAQLFYLPDVIDEAIRQLNPVERQQAVAQRTANATASRRLAERVGRSLSERADMPVRGVRGVSSRVLLAANSPGFLVELGFLTTTADEQRLGSAEYQLVLAEALAEGILAHYGLNTPGDAR